MDINQWILEHGEKEYSEFSDKLTKSRYPLHGVRIPLLRKKAKEMAASEGIEALKRLNDDSFESVMIQGFVIAYSKLPLQEKRGYIYSYLKKVDNWSLVDSFCSTIKPKKPEREDYYQWLKSLRQDEHEFVRRYCLVSLISNYLDDEHIDDIIQYCSSLNEETESNKKANGWLLATAYINYCDQVLSLLSILDDKTYRITKGKIRDSFRISQENKERFVR